MAQATSTTSYKLPGLPTSKSILNSKKTYDVGHQETGSLLEPRPSRGKRRAVIGTTASSFAAWKQILCVTRETIQFHDLPTHAAQYSCVLSYVFGAPQGRSSLVNSSNMPGNVMVSKQEEGAETERVFSKPEEKK